jgi:hypothetical protein
VRSGGVRLCGNLVHDRPQPARESKFGWRHPNLDDVLPYPYARNAKKRHIRSTRACPRGGKMLRYEPDLERQGKEQNPPGDRRDDSGEAEVRPVSLPADADAGGDGSTPAWPIAGIALESEQPVRSRQTVGGFFCASQRPPKGGHQGSGYTT